MNFSEFPRVFAISMLVMNGCSSRDDQLLREQREDRIVKYLDERRYDEAISLAGEESQFAQYRAEAMLGKSGFVPLEFAARVMGSQVELRSGSESGKSISAKDDESLRTLIPECDSAGLTAMKGVSYRCALWRVFRQLPDHAQVDFSGAREVLRQRFSDIRNTSSGYNALCGIVEMASLLSSFRRVLILYKNIDPQTATDDEIQVIFAEIARFADFAAQTLRRTRVLPYFNLSRQITGLENDVILAGNRLNLDYVESSGIPLLIRIAQSTGAQAQELNVIGGKILMIQQLDQVIQLLENSSQ